MDIKDILTEIATEIVEDLKRDIRDKKIYEKNYPPPSKGQGNSSGKLADSIRFEVTDTSIKIFAEDYFDALQFGRRPGAFPPTSAIIDWIKEKPILFENISIDSLAFLIGRKIARKGTDMFIQGGSDLFFGGIINEERISNIKIRLKNEIINSIRSQLLAA